MYLKIKISLRAVHVPFDAYTVHQKLYKQKKNKNQCVYFKPLSLFIIDFSWTFKEKKNILNLLNYLLIGALLLLRWQV